MPKHIQDYCEDRARQGEGVFAIAYALLEIARAQHASASALERIGLGNAASDQGALELLGMQLKDTGEAVAQALNAIAERE